MRGSHASHAVLWHLPCMNPTVQRAACAQCYASHEVLLLHTFTGVVIGFSCVNQRRVCTLIHGKPSGLASGLEHLLGAK